MTSGQPTCAHVQPDDKPFFSSRPRRSGVAHQVDVTCVSPYDGRTVGDRSSALLHAAMLTPGMTIRDLTVERSLGRSSRFEFFGASSPVGPRLIARVVGEVLDVGRLEARVANWASRPEAVRLGLPTVVVRTPDETLLISDLPDGVPWQEATRGIRPEAGLSWLGRLVDALAALHQARTFHGELGASTIRVASDGGVKLLMPGVADLIGSNGEESAWTEPELSVGQEPTASSDVFALGIAASELGGAPCNPGSRRARRAIVRRRRPVPIFVQAHAAWPSELVAAINSTLRGRAERPSNAVVLRVVLRSESARLIQSTPFYVDSVEPSVVLDAPRPRFRERVARRWPAIRRSAPAAIFVILFVLGGRWALDRPYNPRCSAADECAAGLSCESGMCQRSGLVYLPPARFDGGSLDGPVYARDEPFHARLTYGFYIEDAEVTQGEFSRLTSTRPSWFEQCGDDCPVESVNWFEAIEFANLRSEEEGLPRCYRAHECTGQYGSGCPDLEAGDPAHHCVGDYRCTRVEFVGLECVGYRLPTEIEWEYAARGGTREMTYAGTMDFSAETIAESLERIGRIARTAESSEATYGAWPCSTLDGMNASEQCGPGVVRSLESNAYGLYDMLGNVGEWTTDRAVERIADMSGWRCFGRGEVQSSGDRSCEVNTVVDRSLHVDDAAPRVLRGGAFFHSASGSRVSIRNGLRWERRFVDVGFRLARTASPPAD